MFCPNCGTQNPETAQTCSKCSFNIKGAAAPKFKGTMLMMNAPVIPGITGPGGPGGAPGQPPGGSPPASHAPAAPPAAPPAAAAAPPPGAFAAPAGPNRLKGTMVGVAPMAMPGMGAPSPVAVPAAGGAPAPVAMAPAAAMPAPPVAAPAAPRTPAPPPPGNAPQTPLPPVLAPEGASSFSPPVHQGGVNPLGGTVAADTFNPALPPQAFPPYGAAPQQAQPMPAPAQPYGAAPAQPSAAPFPYAAMAAQSPAAAPQSGQSASRSFVPGGPTRRNEVTTWLVPGSLVFGGIILGVALDIVLQSFVPLLGGLALAVAGVVWWTVSAIQMTNELRAVTRDEELAWWPLLVPAYRQYWMWFVVPAQVLKAKRALGVRQPDRPTVLYVLMWHFAVAADINEMVP